MIGYQDLSVHECVNYVLNDKIARIPGLVELGSILAIIVGLL